MAEEKQVTWRTRCRGRGCGHEMNDHMSGISKCYKCPCEEFREPVRRFNG